MTEIEFLNEEIKNLQQRERINRFAMIGILKENEDLKESNKSIEDENAVFDADNQELHKTDGICLKIVDMIGDELPDSYDEDEILSCIQNMKDNLKEYKKEIEDWNKNHKALGIVNNHLKEENEKLKEKYSSVVEDAMKTIMEELPGVEGVSKLKEENEKLKEEVEKLKQENITEFLSLLDKMAVMEKENEELIKQIPLKKQKKLSQNDKDLLEKIRADVLGLREADAEAGDEYTEESFEEKFEYKKKFQLLKRLLK